MSEDVTNPKHYRVHPSGVECIQVTEHMGFNLGNVVKYVWRAGLKGADPLPDLRKAKWYLEREIARIEGSIDPAAAGFTPDDEWSTEYVSPDRAHSEYMKRSIASEARQKLTQFVGVAG